MLIHRSTEEGLPPRLYRHPSEIRVDISAVKARAGEIENMLSVRELLMEFAVRAAEERPEVWIPELAAVVDEAEDALDALYVLKGMLNELSEELEEVKCLMTL